MSTDRDHGGPDGSERSGTGEPIRVGLLTSVGRTLDAFFPPIVDRLTELGFAVTCASGTASSLPGWTPLEGFTQRPSRGVRTALRSVRRWSAAQRHDVVVTNTATASALVRVAGLRAPVVYFCHGLHWGRDDARALPWKAVERALLPRTAGVVTINRDDQAWFERHGARSVHRLATGVGVPLEQWPAAPLPASDTLDLLWAGDMTPRKRPLQAVAVVARLVDLGVPVRLRMLGDGPLHEAVRAEVAARGLGDVVRAEGRGPVSAALGEATALLHTASWEGLPRVALEAAAVGRWCYGFDVKGLRDAPLVRLAPDGDLEALSRLLAADAASGAVRGVPDVRAALDATTAADGLADALLDVLGRRAHRPGTRVPPPA
ncbi:glycosyltransferase [Modestobacter excelsi]|uniref:glycosyltransferase n=1 Tax=Modestobacter excelsi TaxID=2213161 RepID=UPI001C20F2FA|nr:glycosyltransferase [Modestobacter excelsi]